MARIMYSETEGVEYSFGNFLDDLKQGREFFFKINDIEGKILNVLNRQKYPVIFIEEKRKNHFVTEECLSKHEVLEKKFMNHKTLEEAWDDIEFVDIY